MSLIFGEALRVELIGCIVINQLVLFDQHINLSCALEVWRVTAQGLLPDHQLEVGLDISLEGLRIRESKIGYLFPSCILGHKWHLRHMSLTRTLVFEEVTVRLWDSHASRLQRVHLELMHANFWLLPRRKIHTCLLYWLTNTLDRIVFRDRVDNLRVVSISKVHFDRLGRHCT